MCFLPLSSLVHREQAENRWSGGVVVDPSPFLTRGRTYVRNHLGCLPTSLLKVAVLSLRTSGSHMEQPELDVGSPLAERVDFWPRCWDFPALAACLPLSAVTEQGKRLG